VWALLKAAASFASLKNLGEGAEGEFVKLSAFKGPRGREAAEDEVVTFDVLNDVKVAKATETPP